MSLKKKVIGLVLALGALVPTLAQAEHHRHDPTCRHQATGVPGQPEGRYELRTVQRWVEGGYQTVWVPRRCKVRRHRTVCDGGNYQRQFQPGHYQSVQEYVWVALPHPPVRHGQRWASVVR